MIWGLAAPVTAAEATPVPCTDAAVAEVATPAPRRLVVKTPPTHGRYVVVAGDTLSLLASRFDLDGGWQALYEVNRDAVGPDPDLLRPGTRLVVPGRAGAQAPRMHVVVAGDTLSLLASRFDLDGGWQALYEMNRDVVGPDPDLLRPGTTVTLRPPATGASPAADPAVRTALRGASVAAVSTAVLQPVRRLASPAPRVHALAGPFHPRPGRPGMPAWLDVALATVGAVALVALVSEGVRQRRTPPHTLDVWGGSPPTSGGSVR